MGKMACQIFLNTYSWTDNARLNWCIDNITHDFTHIPYPASPTILIIPVLNTITCLHLRKIILILDLRHLPVPSAETDAWVKLDNALSPPLFSRAILEIKVVHHESVAFIPNLTHRNIEILTSMLSKCSTEGRLLFTKSRWKVSKWRFCWSRTLECEGQD
ncbi:hypothetical protein L218DRAFT_713379 [Marasmius fiardii PR-910]|nr:hypothetical protein L218DRAFT_713379 [Marasmius fiardii PR-910]